MGDTMMRTFLFGLIFSTLTFVSSAQAFTASPEDCKKGHYYVYPQYEVNGVLKAEMKLIFLCSTEEGEKVPNTYEVAIPMGGGRKAPTFTTLEGAISFIYKLPDQFRQ